MVFFMDLFLSVSVSVAVAVVSYLLGLNAVIDRVFILVYGSASLTLSALLMYFLRTYRIIIRHFAFRDIGRFSMVAFFKVLFTATLIAFLFRNDGILVYLMTVVDGCVTLLVLLFVRLVMIAVYDYYRRSIRNVQNCTRVLVYGMSDKSAAAVVRLAGSKHFNVIGVINPGSSLSKAVLAEKPVHFFTRKEDFDTIVSNLSLNGVIFVTDLDARREQAGLLKWCSEAGVRSYIIPGIDEMNGDLPSAMHLREIKIEDLLGRDEINVSMDKISHTLSGKVVMVTGAAGSIGSELCRQLSRFGIRRLILFDNAETPMHIIRLELEESFPSLDFVPVIGDVRQDSRLDYVFREYAPQIVFHAAAYKHVPLMEENPCEAVLVNVCGTRNVADKCIQYGVEKMVMVSTDKAVNPTNIMGCTKRLAEIYVQSLGLAVQSGEKKGVTEFVTTRFGNVLGSNGSVVPRFREQIARGGPVTVTHPDINRFFMTIPEACLLVMEAVVLPTENRICVFDMGKPVKIDTLARRMIELSGLVPDQDIKVVYTGLRPGEKLFEEVLSSIENTEPTSHDRIRIARVRTYDYNKASEAVDALKLMAQDVRIPEMVSYMKELVPEYVSNNSVFQKYDMVKHH